MTRVCITEKPSVAKDIAKILGADVRRDGYYEGNGYRVTWTFGHLCTLKEPHDYTDAWKGWHMSSLPMIPPRFGIKLIDDKGIKKQFHVIETLIGEADEVINCGDAGQEGELIQRWVMQKANCAKPVKRLWISSLTDESIREGFKALRPQSDFDSLYHAGLSRAIGDWVLGINATRLYTLKYATGRTLLSIGRVQTPTLALIVARQKEIENFVPEDYWEIKTIYRDTTFGSTRGRYKSEEEAKDVIARIDKFPLKITWVSTKKGKEAPPRLFDLTTLQVECNKRFSFSAEETLRLIQSLYEKKVTTYPRVDTTYLSEDIYPKIPGILRAMQPYSPLTAPLLSGGVPKSKKVFDNSKVTDHHAIIPTDVPPQTAPLSREEKLVYDMVAKRFIAAFYPDCEFLSTTVMADVNGIEFKATGKQIIKPGWRGIYAKEKPVADDDKKDPAENENMPQFVAGESGPHKPSLLKKATQPPKYYTEGTLLRAMETAGRLVEEEELREAMKENGIGRPSTRAAIIETLFKRRYISKERKRLVATPAGIALIDTIKDDLLKSAKLTGLWENKLRKIERKEYDPGQFIAELKELIGRIVKNVMSDNSGSVIATDSPQPAPAAKPAKGARPAKPSAASAASKKSARTQSESENITSVEQIKCPACGEGHLIKGRTAFGCSLYGKSCSFVLPFSRYPADTEPKKLKIAIDKMKKG